MISLDLMKSSEVRIAGDQSICLIYLVFANTNFHFSIRNPTYITGKCQNLHTCNVLIIMVNIRQVNHMLHLKYFEFNIFKYAFELVIIINHQYIAIYLGIGRWLANLKPNRFIILVLDRTIYLCPDHLESTILKVTSKSFI